MIKRSAVLLLFPICFATQAAFAQSGPAAMLVQRNQVLRLQIDEAGTGKAPSLRGSEAASVRNAFDLAVIRTLPNDSSLAEVCEAVAESTSSYVDFADRVGGGEHVGEALSEVEDETAMGMAATVVCTTKLYRVVLAVTQGRMAKQPAKAASAIRSFRTHHIQTLGSTLNGATTMKPANAAMVLDAVLENIEFVAGSLPIAERKRAQEVVRAYRFDDPASQAKLALIAAAFASTTCGTLCQLG